VVRSCRLVFISVSCARRYACSFSYFGSVSLEHCRTYEARWEDLKTYLAATTPGDGMSRNFQSAWVFSMTMLSLRSMCRRIRSKAGRRSATVLESRDAHIFFSGMDGRLGSTSTSSACSFAKSSKRRSIW